MQLDHTHLKVDQTLLQFDQRYLLVSNVNIPLAEFAQIDTVLTRVQQFIAQDYSGIPLNSLQYQVCATYQLRHSVTGEIRHWSGSFNPRGNRLNILSHFQPYQLGTFRAVVTHACTPGNVYNRLRFFHVATDWVFNGITSAIVSLQARVPVDHPTITRRQLLLRRHGRRNRVHVTFYLP